MPNPLFDFYQGELPLLVNFPHSGTWIPQALAARMTDEGRALPDTDWLLPRLFEFPECHRASRLAASFSRYLIDPNRPPDDRNLYPGQSTSKLCPVTTFAGQPIYRTDEPDAAEIEQRRAQYWTPYHQQLQSELSRLRSKFGLAVLLDAHSIAPEVPRLFTGRLSDLNFGTANGQSCDPDLESALRRAADELSGYSVVFNGRFIGGYITRHYGRPNEQISAVQLEISQGMYLEPETNRWDSEKAAHFRPQIARIVEALIEWIEERWQAMN